ncbi:TPR-like protein [Athelia psychrophila]|uniref:TPR-like protein n=1 Tax=Athelia psychrophila TaxID=1759441 RepID=A0A167XK50_9AGAM|nr:TPR-like protein [Fibularhizoctonia sp. CBS 109695]
MSWLKSQLQRVSRSPSPAPKISQSSVLETTRNLCELVSNLGSGALNVPGLQAAGLIGCQIIDILQIMKDNQDACNDLVDDIGQLMSPINLRLQGCRTADVDDELKAGIKRLEEGLQKVRETLQYELRRGRLDRTLNPGRNAGEIAKCKAIINRQFVIFQNSSLMSLQMGMASLKRQADGPRTGEQNANDQIVKSVFTTISPSGPVTNVAGHIFHGNVNMYTSASGGHSVTPWHSSAGSFPSQPAPPEDFFGRDDLVLTLANLFIGNEQRRIAILGAGGLGKTSIALHLMHHEIVVQRFQGREFFVGCDGVTSADGLASRILQILEASASASGNIINALHAALAGALPTLLVLDNFETTWDTQGGHNAVRELLKKIASVKSVSIIITMRATDPPTEIRWSWSETIPALSPASAKDAFLAIHGPLPSGSNSDDEVLDELLKELDYVPLAIHLLAQVSRGFKPPFMLKRWREKKTQMLRVETGARALDRLESVDVSISLSMESLHVDRNPEAIQLLGMLCLLPDGLLGWQERLEVIEKTFDTATTNLFLLRKFALVYTAGDKLGVLSPIRHYVLHHHPPDSQHAQCIYNIIWELVNTYALVSFGPKFRGAVDALSPEMANIGSLIDHAAAYDPGEIIVDIAIQISWHLCFTHPSRHLLQKVSTLVPSVHTKTQARYWQVSSEIMYRQGEYMEAESTFKQARGLFLEIEDCQGAARCSQRLGDTLNMQSNYSEAAVILTDARCQFSEIGDRAGAASCSQSLGDILRLQCDYSEATVSLMDARATFLEIGDRLGAAQCSQRLGNILSEQSNYSEATVILTDARTQFIEIGERMGAAQCSSTLGEILSNQGNYSEATAIFTDVRAQLIEIGERLGAARCSISLGDIHFWQGDYSEATVIFTDARAQFIEIGERLGAAQCSQSLGNNLRMQSEYAEAAAILTDARAQFIEIGNRVGDTECSTSLGIILIDQGNHTEAESLLAHARDQFIDIGRDEWTAYCSLLLEECVRARDGEENTETGS